MVQGMSPIITYPGSIEPHMMNIYCYAPRDNGASYGGFRNTAKDGRTCNRWSGKTHNYCRNEERDPMGPWCYVGNGEKVSCDIPRCTQDVECYVGEGWGYKGTAQYAANGGWCDLWPDT